MVKGYVCGAAYQVLLSMSVCIVDVFEGGGIVGQHVHQSVFLVGGYQFVKGVIIGAGCDD